MKRCVCMLSHSAVSNSSCICPWDFPGRNTGAGCHFLLHGIFPIRGQLRGQTYDSCTGRQILYHWATWKGQWLRKPIPSMDVAFYLQDGYSVRIKIHVVMRAQTLTFPLPLHAVLLISKTFSLQLSLPLEIISLLEPNF